MHSPWSRRCLLFLPVLLIATGSAHGQIAVKLRGSGEPFLEQSLAEWLNRTQPQVDLRYEEVGSAQGLRDFAKGARYFVGVQLPASDEQRQATTAKPLLALPINVGAVIPVYSLPVKGLRFSGRTLARIFLGEIQRWNDPAIRADNPGKELPDSPLVVVRRSDSSPATYYLTGFLAKAWPEFTQHVAVGASVRWPTRRETRPNGEVLDWPTGHDVEGSREAVCAEVKSLAGAIGYAELAEALLYQDAINFAAVENASGKFVAPTLTALESASSSLVPGGAALPADAYPIAHLSWLVMSGGTREPAKDGALKAYAQWALTQGQAINKIYGYAPLSATLAKQAREEAARLPGVDRVAEHPVQVAFAAGGSAAAISAAFGAGGDNRLASREYVLRAKAGQQLELGLTGTDAETRLEVACPDGGIGLRGRDRFERSMKLPESGDYTIRVTRTGAKALPAAELRVAITGVATSPAAAGYDGTYSRGDAEADIKTVARGKVAFHFTAVTPNGHTGQAEGTVSLRKGVGVFKEGRCRLRLRFAPAGRGILSIEELDRQDCGFGAGVGAGGEYRLCGEPDDDDWPAEFPDEQADPAGPPSPAGHPASGPT